jgi:hypothetical protein
LLFGAKYNSYSHYAALITLIRHLLDKIGDLGFEIQNPKSKTHS